MAQIRKKMAEDKDLTIMEVVGKVTSREIIDALKDFYESGITPNLLWDLSKSDLSELTIDQLREIISAAKEFAHLRAGGKTALFTTLPMGFGIARTYEILADANQAPVLNRVFRSLDEAMTWLKE